MSAKPLIIVGAGGFARETLWVAHDCPAMWRPLGFLDDAEERQGTSLCDLPILGRVGDWHRFGDAHFVVAIGAPRARRSVVQKMNSLGQPPFATLIHPSAQRSRFVSIGPGTIVTANCILTTQVAIGSHCILNLGVTVGHDVVMGDYTTVAPLAPISGNVSIGEGVEIGTGACVKQGLRLGRGSVIGMGAVVTRPTDDNTVVVGNPASPVKNLEPF